MPYDVICMSGPDGSGMREVAGGIAERTGFTVVDEEIILRAAAEGGVDPSVVADVERRRSFIERALDALGTSTDHSAYSMAGVGGYALPDLPMSDDLRNLIRAAIEETAASGNVIIVAHASSHALASRPDVLRVLITASPGIRESRVAAERSIDEKDAAKEIEKSDNARADYLKRFYGAKAERPDDYDVVVNTDKLSTSEAVSLVSLAAGR
jgi:cytidylate kinase